MFGLKFLQIHRLNKGLGQGFNGGRDGMVAQFIGPIRANLARQE